MLQLSQLQAQSTHKIINNATLGQYSLLKILLNKDYLAKNQLGEKYLLCEFKYKQENSVQQLANTHIIHSVDTVTEESHRYQVFPMEKKLFWAGDSAYVKDKSQIYCLSVLYSAIKYILKPLIGLPRTSQLAKCICLQNLWFRGSSAFLFLCNRHKERLSLKTEMKNRKTINQVEVEQEMLQRIGQLFWDIFCAESNGSQNNSRSTFREIVRKMVKGQTNLSELQDIMEDKLAKRRFLSALNNKKYTIDTQQLVQNKETIDENVLSKLENIPVRTGKIYHGLHFDKRKSLQPTTQNRRYPKLNSLCEEEELIPPSFTNSKRKKRFSLFSGNKLPYRTVSISGREGQSMTINIEKKNQNEDGKNEMPVKYSLDVNGSMTKWKDSKEPNSKGKSIERRRQLRRFFEEVKNIHSNVQHSRLEVMNERSKQKALAIFKKSIDCDTLSEDKLIDDKIFVANLRVKRNEYKQNLQRTIVKACEYMHLKPADSNKTGEHQTASEVKIHNDIDVRQSIGTNSMPKQQIVNNLSKQQSVNKGSKYGQLGLARVFNEAVIAEQQPSVSIINEKQLIDFNVENRSGLKTNPSGTRQSNLIEQSIALQQNSRILPKPHIPKQIVQQQTDNKSVEAKQQKFTRYESQVEILPLSKINQVNKVEPPKQQIQQTISKQLQLTASPRNPVSKIPTTNTLVKEESIAKDKAQVKERLMEEETRENFSFAEVKQAKINEIEEIKSFISPLTKKANTTTQTVAYSEQEIKLQKPVKKEPKSTKNITQELEDEIEEITLLPNKKSINTNKEEIKQSKPKQDSKEKIEIEEKPTQVKQPASQTSINPSRARKRLTESEKQQEEAPVQREQKPSKPERLKTGQSNTSSNGNRPVKKQIEEYIFMINKMGEAVAKTSKLNKKLQKIEWFTGVYYLYKRFFCQRKKIQKYLSNNEPRLTRNSPFSEEEWNEWLKKGEKEAMLAKCIQDNANIEKSIKKMMKKLESQQLPATILLNAPLNKNIEDSSRIAVEYVVDEYDQLVEQDMLKDPELHVHICEMVNALYVMAELDGKVKEKRPVMQYSNIKRSKEELSRMVQAIFDLYQQQ